MNLLRAGTAAWLAAGALGTWLGMQAVRSELMMVVWNVAEDAPANVMGAVAGALWLVGLLAWIPARLIGMSRATAVFAVLLAVASVLRAAWVSPGLTPAFAFAACIAWMWWFPAWLRAGMSAGHARLLPVSIVLGVVLQQAAQAALHGLDLNVMVGWPAAGATVLIALAFVATVTSQRAGDTAAAADAGGAASAAAVGPYLFLLMTLLANPARISLSSGLAPAVAIALTQAGLLAGLALASWRGARWLGLIALCAMPVLDRFDGWPAAALLFVAVSTATAAFVWAFGATRPGLGRVHTWFAAGALAMFALIFAFYSRTEWPWAWTIAMVLLALVALPGRRTAPPMPATAVALGAAAGVLGLALGQIPSGAVPARTASSGVSMLDYNIHQGLDARSLPGIQAIADLVESVDADIVTLQEVNRGMNLSGGVDNLAWLSWRLPQYHVAYGPMHGALYGNVILSRFPIAAQGWQRYEAGLKRQPRGFVWTRLATPLGELTVVSTHLASYESAAAREDRAAQSKALAALAPRVRTVLAGDLNDEPDSETVGQLVRAGLADAVRQAGLTDAKTFHALAPVRRIDYVLLSQDLKALSARIPEVWNSDHRPVLVSIGPAH